MYPNGLPNGRAHGTATACVNRRAPDTATAHTNGRAHGTATASPNRRARTASGTTRHRWA